MAQRVNISVSFTPRQARFLASCVTSGHYQSASEVVREALRLLEDQRAHREAEIQRARLLIREGADQIDQGQVVEGASFFQEWDEELTALETARSRKPR